VAGHQYLPAGFLHDLKYWAGYPGEDVARLIADAELMIDVARLLHSTAMAETMFHGGGSAAANTSTPRSPGASAAQTRRPGRRPAPAGKSGP